LFFSTKPSTRLANFEPVFVLICLGLEFYRESTNSLSLWRSCPLKLLQQLALPHTERERGLRHNKAPHGRLRVPSRVINFRRACLKMEYCLATFAFSGNAKRESQGRAAKPQSQAGRSFHAFQLALLTASPKKSFGRPSWTPQRALLTHLCSCNLSVAVDLGRMSSFSQCKLFSRT
jgi:hypothetical protein